MTEKGLEFTKQAVSKFRDIISQVVIGQDASVINDYSAEIVAVCEEAGVRHSFRQDFPGVESEYVIAISWRWMINHPAEKLIVFHDSLLPRYRGFAPLVSALINGDTTIGVSALFGASEYDRGDILHQSALEVAYPITIAEAITSLTQCYLSLGLKVLEALASGEPLHASRQDETQATYSLWRDDDDYRIDWSLPASKIRRFVDAVGYPYKGALCYVDTCAARVIEAEEVPDVHIENRVAGKVIFIDDGRPVVVCGQGLLRILRCVADDSGTSVLPLPKFRVRFS
ncbi:methionyl-tRNA formyltransferase [Bordetella bronchialis]|uniref:Methionyl-tRNA formyltransferase n=2 Tax=Bordetella bronchialis TaxID=463025 RepID=A0A193FVR2_9BORD|nr:formyltransferase family protein [Bordetella bronchialis]ANN66775.1 hypothetical protein BAU06_11210 [Bordetella bronchialis]ANN71852.1 hypothetical protein BAU08_11410 [Bordetella bronchialis]